MTKIQLENISMSFGETKALIDVNLSVEKGKYIVILGPSGAGKTTLLKVIAGLYKPKKGRIIIDGDKDITKLSPEGRGIAFLPQDYGLFPKKTVWENISFSPKIQKFSNTSELVKEFLLMVHLTDRPDAYPHELSGGMKQRTALGRALATNYSIILLDEPLRALDARLRLEIRNELKKMVKDLGFTVFHVTHDQEEAFSIGDSIVVLNQGRIEQIGNQEHLYRNPVNEFVASFG
ncbi:MAG: ABC transporter ATP-binding protein [Candidatus Hodarchaeales archaeon]|jgi:ABC-type Fe3+/spermidine/putrescine transport system ATPase subunit